MEIEDYLIAIDDIEWTDLFSEWKWLIKPGTSIQPWMMNSFGDLFWFDEQERINFLTISDGANEIVANNEDEFFERLEDPDNLMMWLLIDLVDELKSQGTQLGEGQCYGFKLLPYLEGEFETSNVYVSDLQEYWDFCGDAHRQLDGLPDGSEISIELLHRDGIDD